MKFRYYFIAGFLLPIVLLVLWNCSELPDPIEIKVEVPVYKPTRVAVKFLYHSDILQTVTADTIYLDQFEYGAVWDVSQYGACIDKVKFELIELK